MTTDLVHVSASQAAVKRLLFTFFGGLAAATKKSYHCDLRALARYMGVSPETNLEEQAEMAAQALVGFDRVKANVLVLDWRNSMIEAGKSSSTINRRLAAAASIVKMAYIAGLLDWELNVKRVADVKYRDTRGPGADAVEQIVKRLQEAIERKAPPKPAKKKGKKKKGSKGSKGNKAKGGPSGPVVRRLVKASAIRDLAIVRLLFNQGLRRGEVSSLDVSHVDLVGKRLSILGKARREREWVSLTRLVCEALQGWLEARAALLQARGLEDYPQLFISLSRSTHCARLEGDGILQIIDRLGKDIGLRIRPHGLRHSAITEVLDKSGGNVRAAQRFSRHRSLDTLTHYDDSRVDLAKQMADLLER